MIRAPILLAAALFLNPAWAQYTDRRAIDDLGGPKAFVARRTELAKRLKTGYFMLFARNVLPEAGHYREDNDFFYFTGLQEPGAVLFLDVVRNSTIVFLPQQAPRVAQVFGPNLLSLPKQEQVDLGYVTVLPVDQMDRTLSTVFSVNSGAGLWLRLGFPDKADGARMETGYDAAEQYAHPYGATLPPSQLPARLLAQRYPMIKQRDATPDIDAMRNIKTPEEIGVLRRNGKISAEGDRLAMAHADAGMYQYQIEAEASNYFYSHGAEGVAYPAIVGSGTDINTWHYFSNRHKIDANGLVVFDFAASLDHMTMDITRTFNISGKFTPEQAQWYAVDLESQKAVIALLKPEHTYEEAADAGKAVYQKAGIEKQWRGFPGHFVGLATHDVFLPKGPIKPGQVVTVEPIVEFPEKHLHFRVEDTILITAGEPEILSSAIPKEMGQIEKLVGSER